MNDTLKGLDELRAEIAESYSQHIESSIQLNIPQLKLINFGTGSGKSFQFFHTVYETFKLYPNLHTIAVYIAPLREHLDVPEKLMAANPDIPVYTLYSVESKFSDEHLLKYDSWFGIMLGNQSFWDSLKRLYLEETFDTLKHPLKLTKNFIRQLNYLKNSQITDEDFLKSEREKITRNINTNIEEFLEKVIRSGLDESLYPSELFELIGIFFPLHLLRERNGILLLTYKKFETKMSYFHHNGERWVRRNRHRLDEYINNYSSKKRKFIIALDEQEDGYQIMLNSMIDIISPEKLAINNALSSISRELSLLFSKRNGGANRKFLKFIEDNPEAYHEFEGYLKKGKDTTDLIKKNASSYERLIVDGGNSPAFLSKTNEVYKGFEKSITEIRKILKSAQEEEKIKINFEVLTKVFSKFEKNRSILISKKLYREISHELVSIFSYNNVYVYNIEPLKKLFLYNSPSGHIQLLNKPRTVKTSLAELVYAILATRTQITNIKDLLENVLTTEDTQSRSLDVWSQQIQKANRAYNANEIVGQSEYLNRDYVYESYKSIINILEIARYKHPKNNLINDELKEVSIGNTAILSSPEFKLLSLLNSRGGNALFLISATGGVNGDLSTSFDMRYLEDNLRNLVNGQSTLSRMNKRELKLSEDIRTRRLSYRNITTQFFDNDIESFPNNLTKDVALRFEKTILKDFVVQENKSQFSQYKKQELQNFIRFLFYLFEDDDINDSIAFTQTLGWVRKLLKFWKGAKKSTNFKIEESSEHPGIFFIQISHKRYCSSHKIKLILYDAQFNNKYYEKAEKHYAKELQQKEGEKIFFLSAYQSAAKGLNPVIKIGGKDSELEKDFDLLVLLMDSYYSPMKISSKSKNKDFGTAKVHFTLMKSVVSQSSSQMKIRDFNTYLNTPDATGFKNLQHLILLGKTKLQTIGRSERRNYPQQVIKIFINEETRKNLVNFYQYIENNEPDEIRKFSVNNYAVYKTITKDESKRIIPNYENHVYEEIDAFHIFDKERKKLLSEISTFHQDQRKYQVVKAWDSLRNPIAFSSPSAYMEKLAKSVFYDKDFANSLFYIKKDSSAFSPYLGSESENGKTYQIISDNKNGNLFYRFKNLLCPDFLKVGISGYDLKGDKIDNFDTDSVKIIKLFRQLVPNPEIFETYIPRPDFFFDILYPSLTEFFTERWIVQTYFKGMNWSNIKRYYHFTQIDNFRHYHKLYEKFDLFYEKESVLFCIDVKAWSRYSDKRLSKDLIRNAQLKLEKIALDYPEFTEIKGLLLNLQTSKEKYIKHSKNLFSGSLIHFDDNHLPVESSILDKFLFNK